MLGARIVESWADAELATAASNVIAKVEAVSPERLRGYMANTALLDDFAQRKVTLLRADWTRRDPTITQALTGLRFADFPA